RERRIADLRFDLLVRALQFAEHVVEDRFVYEQATRRRAALAAGADRAEHDRRDRELEIRAFVDDDRVVAAELEQRAAHAARDALADHAPDLRRAREADQRNAVVVDER